MQTTQIEHLLGLSLVVMVTLLGVALVLRGSGRAPVATGALLIGYPPSRYPAQHLMTIGPLAMLAATQSRLVAMYGHMDQASDSAIWLRIFLQELREIMDTVYRTAVITDGYGHTPAVGELVVELQQIERVLVEQLGQRMLQRDGDAHAELLAGRVATLHLCVRELAQLAEQPDNAIQGV